MLQALDRSVLAAYIFNPILSSSDFFNTLAVELRMNIPPTKAEMLRAFGHVLLTRARQGLRTVLVVDEAHLLPPHLMEEIRLLSNFETNREKLLQIVLCGQPELHQLLAKPELRQLKQRISLRCSVKPLSEAETGRYINWRLRLARAANPNLFQPEAVRLIYGCSGGIPRIINNICDNALLTGFGDGRPTISYEIVRRVIDELDLSPAEGMTPRTTGELIIDESTEANSPAELARADKPGHAPIRWPQEPLDNVRYIRPEVAPQFGASATAIIWCLTSEMGDLVHL